jgi:hypothetical protein
VAHVRSNNERISGDYVIPRCKYFERHSRSILRDSIPLLLDDGFSDLRAPVAGLQAGGGVERWRPRA